MARHAERLMTTNKIKITRRAIMLFRQMMDLKCVCQNDDDRCSSCIEYDRLDAELSSELKLPPWQGHPVVIPSDYVVVHRKERQAGNGIIATAQNCIARCVRPLAFHLNSSKIRDL
jgi:hypothetical protein